MLIWLLAALVLFNGKAFAQAGEYEGPEILSRTGGDVGQRSGKAVDLRFYADVVGIYDTGITPVSVDSSGKITQVGGLTGLEADIGLYGRHNWRRTTLSLDYHGDYRDYSHNKYFNGTNQQLRLSLGHQLTRHVTLRLRESAGTASYALGAFGYNSVLDPTIVQPTNAIFDSQVSYGQTGVDLIVQKTARLSFSIGADGYAVREANRALVGLNGYGAHGDVAYRLNRVSTISVDYAYQHFEYEGLFGSSDVHELAAGYYRRLNRTWQLGLRAGAFRVESKGLEVAALDPAVAAILGTGSTIVAFYGVHIYPLVDVRLSAKFHHSSFTAFVNESANPGNGIYLTSRAQSGGAVYSYTGVRKLNLSFSGDYSNLHSVGQNLGNFKQWDGGLGFTYAVAKSFHLVGRIDGRHFDVGALSTASGSPFRQNSFRVSLGVGYAPGDLPLSLW